MANLPKEFLDLQASNPEEAALLKTLVTKSVSDVEHHLGDLDGTKKAELSDQQTIDLLDKVYDGVDMFFNFPAPVDFLSKEVLIPLIPGLRVWVVEFFNQLGLFQKKSQGVS